MKKFILCLGSIFLLSLFPINKAKACECVGWNSISKSYKFADTVLLGTITQVNEEHHYLKEIDSTLYKNLHEEENKILPIKVSTIYVNKYWKGGASKTTRYWAGLNSCSISLDSYKGRQILLFSKQENGILKHASFCGQTTSAKKAKYQIQYLDMHSKGMSFESIFDTLISRIKHEPNKHLRIKGYGLLLGEVEPSKLSPHKVRQLWENINKSSDQTLRKGAIFLLLYMNLSKKEIFSKLEQSLNDKSDNVRDLAAGHISQNLIEKNSEFYLPLWEKALNDPSFNVRRNIVFLFLASNLKHTNSQLKLKLIQNIHLALKNEQKFHQSSISDTPIDHESLIWMMVRAIVQHGEKDDIQKIIPYIELGLKGEKQYFWKDLGEMFHIVQGAN